uniref:tRNA-yW synthesizing protein 5 n=1 Tax=Sinocyclocheilus anshuiensis TaxID=1608454 RepID=A0A671K463_9TELE
TFLRDIYPLVTLGPCARAWTVSYLAQRGGDREVKVHVSPEPRMDFLHKNFVYRTLPFDKFIQRAAEAKHSDFFISECVIKFELNVSLLIHCNLNCDKMIFLGDKSEVLDIDTPDLQLYPEFVKASRYECILEPGDLLFIPALWFHNTLALQFGVGVNVFWRHLPPESYDKKDPYGNKDPVAATRALQSLERTLGILEELPPDYRDFYARQIVLRTQSRAYLRQPMKAVQGHLDTALFFLCLN